MAKDSVVRMVACAQVCAQVANNCLLVRLRATMVLCARAVFKRTSITPGSSKQLGCTSYDDLYDSGILPGNNPGPCPEHNPGRCQRSPISVSLLLSDKTPRRFQA